MKQILVFSDSHGNNANMLKTMERYPETSLVLHMGDIQSSVECLESQIPCPIKVVKGNCDWGGDLPAFLEFSLAGKKILMTHGHHYVNFNGTESLKYWAMEREADVVMFGHTHVPLLEQSSSLTVLNPGSISQPRQYDRIPTFTIITIDLDDVFHYNMCKFH